MRLLLISLLILLSSCVDRIEPVKKYGLELTDYKLEIARKSLENINILLTKVGFKNFYLYDGKLNNNGIALLWVGEKALSQSATDMMFVLAGCSCVVVQPRVFIAWLNNYQTVAGNLDEDVDDQVNVLSYLLLHELGHINHGEVGRAASVDANKYNRDSTLDKSKEKNADNFASNILLEILQDNNNFSTWLPAANIQMSLGSLAFDLQGKRVIDNFACSILDAPCAFHDMGDTHENFEFRVLQANCLMAPDVACMSLEDFNRRRNSTGGLGSGLLFEKKF